MSSIDRGLDNSALFTEDLRAAIWRRLGELSGLMLMTLALATVLALTTWSVRDPSLSHATDAPVHNLLGYPGAIAADLLMQLLGLSAIVLTLPVAVWGWRLVTHRPLDREILRIVFWLAATSFAAAFASCVPRSETWPLPTGLGGVVGDAMMRLPFALTGGAPSWLTRASLAIGAGALALISIGVSIGLFLQSRASFADDIHREAEAFVAEEEKTSISIGWLFHSLLSLKSRLDRLLARPKKRSAKFASDGRAALRLAPGFARSQSAEMAAEEEFDNEVEPKRRTTRRTAPRPFSRRSGGYILPSLSFLAVPRAIDRTTPDNEEIEENAEALESVLEDFGVKGDIINARPGPVVTLYELEPAPGIKSSRVIGLADDIARSMSAVSARVAVVPGRNAIGIELPNEKREKVYLREMLAYETYNETSAKLPLCLGKTIGGEPVVVDLTRMPHLLIAGTTGSGKSVAINTMILSLVYRLKPEQCRLIMVDPKMLELSVYDGIPHLLTPVVTDPKKAIVALKWAVREMEERYKMMSKLGVRNIDGYNARLAEAKSKGESLSRTVHTGYDKESGEAIYEKEKLDLDPLPYLVVIVDEMADLMMVAGKDIEAAIQRLAQMARAAGIHVVLATQRPSVDVITGTIKANFPTRISFQVTSKIDSRTILGEQGAEQLLGQGDMLYMAGGGRIIRIHGPFVSDEEVEKVVHHLKAQGVPQYLEAVTAEQEEDGAVFDSTGMVGGEANDLYSQAVQIVLRDRKASTSYIQRRLQIGYNRAATIMERMEEEGVVGQPNHAGKREILVGGEGE
ncbi:MAG: DNA translocase FtsK 4TM domain-containing protein [Rhizobiales bacterium]|nr:DNA translocase FtsK 4TM domain-containing protein [Hyphomicrobiales bacterium]